LYELFKNAPDLGSLINPAELAARDRMFTADYAQVAPVLEKALAKERESEDPVAAVFGAAAEEVASAAQLLAGKYTLVATNVPYLGRGKQDDVMKEFCESSYPDAKADLATVFVERCREFTISNGAYALVTPQNWLFLTSYKKLRVRLLHQQTWNMVVKLGENGFESAQAAGAFTSLNIITNEIQKTQNQFIGIDASESRSPVEKEETIRTGTLRILSQNEQHRNPDSRVVLESIIKTTRLEQYAKSVEGLSTGDGSKYIRLFWELPKVGSQWCFLQGSPERTQDYGGREQIVFWENGNGELSRDSGARVQGHSAWNKRGVIVGRMRNIRSSLYLGDLYDKGCVVLVPKHDEFLPAIWYYCSSEEFENEIRILDTKTSVATATIAQVPFDLEYWQQVVNENGPLPEPYSSDSTQWLFNGDVVTSENILQVAVARLLGYQWPQQKEDKLVELADRDGIVCLPPVAGEQPATERLRGFLNQAFEDGLSPDSIAQFLANAGFAGKGLDEWLRDGFFAQHCQLFHNRPFIWHIWDGRKDGFAALVNYHKLDATRLDNLIYHHLGAWITAQRADQKAGVAGADGRLVAALDLQKKLQFIREGEPPYDIFVRWKSFAEQPLGWEPDLNDGVRLNIRPFVMAGVLRSKFTINWNKDRGKNPDGSERLNDLHFTRAEKMKAKK